MIAHINSKGEIQTVEEHLKGTAEKAGGFAAEFDCEKMGYLCGLMHDIGKYSAEFQRRIQDPEHVGRVDHSTAGAKELKGMGDQYLAAAMAVAGHHSGLLDGGNYKLAREYDGTFLGRMKNNIPDYSEWKKEIVTQSADHPGFCMEGPDPGFTMSFFVRMLFSCLVDADYLDTERFMEPGRALRGGYCNQAELVKRFEAYVKPWFQRTEFDGERHRELCLARNEILKSCMERGAEGSRGFYTLTVPTGGGKTTASLGFALKHMWARGMKRIIYVIPYTSIIDQNAQVFCDILGSENVLEHHSGILYEAKEDGELSEADYRKLLATENWDAPVIVTTAVQFFESLYACKTSKCRKLHNIANSVVIFDEAQTMPIPYLKPCVAAMEQLVHHYHATVVLCTATQPALEDVFREYDPAAVFQEICPDVPGKYELFRRTRIRDKGMLTMEELVGIFMDNRQMLCIVNRRRTAQELYEQIKGEGSYCLTTLLCPADRKKQIQEIRERLQQGQPCRVIATSLIEAGVDLDFPTVFRQEAGLDSVIQAAGRCNREGKRPLDESNVYVFRLEEEPVPFLRQNVTALRYAQRRYEDVSDLEAVRFYFQFYRELLGEENLDQKEIIRRMSQGVDGKRFPFAWIAKEFCLIEKKTETIYILKKENEELIRRLSCGEVDKQLFRELGQYGVDVYPEHFRRLWEAGCIERVGEMAYVLRDESQYSEETGLKMDVETGVGIFI